MPKRPKPSIATLAIPMPRKVQENAEQRPVAVTFMGKPLSVESILERWEDEEFWWRDDPFVRVTYRVSLRPVGQLDPLNSHESSLKCALTRPARRPPL